MGVTEAVRRDVEALGPAAVGSALAELALSLARELDHTPLPCEHCGVLTPHNRTSATARAGCAKALIDALRELRALVPVVLEDDEIERARKRRADRLAGQSAAESSSPS